MNNTLQFDGESTYIEVPLASPTHDGGAVTIEFWNHPDGNREAFAFLFSAGTGLHGGPNWVGCHAPWSDGTIYWDSGKGARVHAPYPHLNKWTHVALVSAGTTTSPGFQAIYLNGELAASKPASVDPGRAFSKLLIGAGEAWSPSTAKDYFYKGRIDAFRVWDRVRSQEEIARTMNTELIGDEEGLVACFNFNWGLPGMESYTGENFWSSQLNRLPNSVEGGSDGELKNFPLGSWKASEVEMTCPVEPVFHLKKTDSGPPVSDDHFYTGSLVEKAEKVAAGWTDEGVAFHAHRGPAPGTSPVYQLNNDSDKHHVLTIDSAERYTLDPRTKRNKAAGDWDTHGIVAYASKSKNGDAVALYKGYNPTTKSHLYTTDQSEIAGDYMNNGIACWVLPADDKSYQPTPIEFDDRGLSEHLWYAVLCRPYQEKTGLQLDAAGKLAMAEIPQKGDCSQFQWRIEGNELINRASPTKVLAVVNGEAGVADRNVSSPLPWALQAVANRGTDCFNLTQSSKALSCNNGALAVVDPTAPGDNEAWTMLAMELREGFTMPGTPAAFSDLPFSKYLRAGGINIVGTGSVSDWAMLRVKLVVDNMMGALKDSVDVGAIKDREVIVFSGDDSSEELTSDSCLGIFYDTDYVEQYRGGHARGLGRDLSFCFVTEEYMAQKAHFSGSADSDEIRMFDQVVHEFAHMMDLALGMNGDACPVASESVGLSNKESMAISIQCWFESIGIVDALYRPATRQELKDNYKSRYDYVARFFDPKNVWTPPVEPRTRFAVSFKGDDPLFYDGYFVGNMANAATYSYKFFSKIDSIQFDGSTVDDVKINGELLGAPNRDTASVMALSDSKYISEIEADWNDEHILYIKVSSNQPSYLESGRADSSAKQFHLEGRLTGIGVYYDDSRVRAMHFHVDD